jgi:hypothetical protein
VSLLTICQNVVASINFGASPASIVGNSDALARQMLALVNQAVPRIAGRHNWQALTKLHTITTANGTESYALPSDLGHYIGDTFWDASNYTQMGGSISPTEWQRLKRSVVASGVNKRFRIYDNLVYIYPTPTAVETLVAEYISAKPVLGLTYKATFTADADAFVLPERLLELDLKWRLLSAKGLPYAEEMNEAEREIERTIAQDVPAGRINVGVDTARAPRFIANVPPTVASP